LNTEGDAFAGGFIGSVTQKGVLTMDKCYSSAEHIAAGGSDTSSFAGGLIGLVDCDATVQLFNCENQAEIQSSYAACGLFSNVEASSVSIYNCANKGTLTGISKYAISRYIANAQSIVSVIEDPICINEIQDPCDSRCYCPFLECCSYSLNTGDNYYYTQGVRLDLLLNEAAAVFSEPLYWSSQLDVSDHLTVNVNGNPVHVEYNSELGSITELHECFKATDCEVVDYYSSAEYSEKTFIRMDMNVKTRKRIETSSVAISSISNSVASSSSIKSSSSSVDPKPISSSHDTSSLSGTVTVVLDVERIEESRVNRTQLQEDLAKIAGVDPSNISVEVKVDEEGYVYSIIVYLPDEESADNIVTYVNDGEGQDSSNEVLRHVTHASIQGRSLSRASHHFASIIVFVTMILFVFILQ